MSACALWSSGVEVANDAGGNRTIENEFNLLSEKAFRCFRIRTSVQGIEFERWLPLPLPRRHYQMVKSRIEPSLREIAGDARLGSTSTVSRVHLSSFPWTLWRFPGRIRDLTGY